MDLVERLVGAHVRTGHGARTAYVDPDIGEVSYSRLYDAARDYAATLHQRGVPEGTRGLLVADDSVATAVAVLGLWLHGCVPVLASPVLTEDEIRFMAADCAAAFVHLDAPAARQRALEAAFAEVPATTGERVRAVLRSPTTQPPVPGPACADWPADRAAVLQYTSGSTGEPKGVLHSSGGIEAVLRGFGSLLRLNREDVVLSTAKMSFGYGFGNSLLLPLAAGACSVLLRGGVDAHVVAAAVRRHQPTVLFSVPRTYAALLTVVGSGEGSERSRLRLAVSAGEHLPAHLAARFQERFGVPLINGLGATEVLHIVVATPPEKTVPGSTGRPVPGVTATVRDDDGQPLPPGADGRLHIAGGCVALGYLNRPDAQRRTFAQGGAFTSDIVRVTEDGDVRYLCRADDLLNLGGYKVAPGEIENAVRKTEGVADCAVIAAPDDDGLQSAVAYAVPVAGADPTAVRRAILRSLRANLAQYKRPARVVVLDALPVTSTGKLARYRLRDLAERQ